MQPKNPLRGHLAALLTIFIWGITFISIKILLVTFSPVEILFYRLVMALAVLLTLCPPRFLRGFKIGEFVRTEWPYMAAGLCGVTLYFLFQNIALTFTLAANVSVLTSVAPLFTALAAVFFLREKLKANFFLGFAAAMAGIVLVSYNGSMILKLNPLGDVLSVLAAFVWSFYTVLIKTVSTRQGSLLGVTRKVVTYGLLFLLPFLPVFRFEFGLERLLVLPNLLNLLFLGVGASALCFLTWNYAVAVIGPLKTSAYIYAIPVITIVSSALVLHEPVTLAAGVGTVLILAGMALSERGRSG